MRVLFYTDTPGHGGAERQMELLAKYLQPLGAEVHLAYGGYSQLEQERFAPFCPSIYALPTIHKHDPRHYQRLKEILRRGQYDLIHIHLWNPGACRYAFWAAEEVGVPIVTTEHDPFALSGVKRMIKNRCLQKTRQTIVISRDNFRLMREVYGQTEKQLTVVHNGIEVDRFMDRADERFPARQGGLFRSEDLGSRLGGREEIPQGETNPPAWLETLGITHGSIVITCIAELHPRKGHQYLFRAFKQMEMTAPRIHLLLAGAGPLEQQFHEQYGEHPTIHFLGWRDDIPAILKVSDVFILPSLKEAFGLVLLEAMASGVAVIGTNAGGVPDIIEDGKTGLLVPPANSGAIHDGIMTLLRNPDFKRDLEKAARARVMEYFTAGRMAKETMEVYQLAVKDKE